jgi:hypothetical protein
MAGENVLRKCAGAPRVGSSLINQVWMTSEDRFRVRSGGYDAGHAIEGSNQFSASLRGEDRHRRIGYDHSEAFSVGAEFIQAPDVAGVQWVEVPDNGLQFCGFKRRHDLGAGVQV